MAMRILNGVAAIAALTFLSLSIPAYAEILEHPKIPITNAFVSKINHDWVEITISFEGVWDDALKPIKDRIYNSGELWDVADFACGLYDRKGVMLSHSYGYGGLSGAQFTSITYLFACAIP